MAVKSLICLLLLDNLFRPSSVALDLPVTTIMFIPWIFTRSANLLRQSSVATDYQVTTILCLILWIITEADYSMDYLDLCTIPDIPGRHL